MELTKYEQITLEAIDEIQGVKREYRQVPDYAQLHEVYNYLRPELPSGFEPQVFGALRSLCRRGLIECHVTVNKLPMFGIKD